MRNLQRISSQIRAYKIPPGAGANSGLQLNPYEFLVEHDLRPDQNDVVLR